MEDNYIIAPVVEGQVYEPVVKVGDTLPIGAEVDYDGSVVPNGWEQIDDSWETLTLGSEFKNYSNNNINQPRIKKEGNVIMIEGAVSPINDISTANGSTHTITTIPEKYRPKRITMTQVCQGSGSNKWLLMIATNGDVSMSRYGTTEFITAPANCWLPFNFVYLV